MILIALALAQEDHSATAPAPIQLDEVRIPDGPPRTVTARPGETLQTLVGNLPRGSHLVLLAGQHAGPLLLDRPIELSGEPGAVLTGGGAGSVLVVAAPDVHVHDLRVTGGGHLSNDDDSGIVVGADRVRIERVTVDNVYLGIDFRMAADGVVTDSHISGDPTKLFGERGDAIRLWESARNHIEHNEIADTRDMVIWYSSDNVVRDNLVRGSRYGTHLMHSDHNEIVGNRFVDDVVGVFVMYSSHISLRDNVVTGALGPAGVGFGFKESDEIEASGNALVSNTTGLYLDTTPHNLGGKARFQDNIISANGVGVRFHGPQYGGELLHNAFQVNRAVVAVDGGVDGGKYRVEHNVWSDYEGYDLDGDGIGDVPFVARSLAGSLMDRVPTLDFFVGTPAATLLDLFGEAFPMFRPKPIVSDLHPMMNWEAP